jgi:DNA polymerase-3 subunit beta
VLRGVHLDGGCATATDSYRLLSFELGFEVDPVTVPAEPLKAALGDCEKVSIGTTGHQVLVDTGGARWILRVLDGDYPKWRSLTSNPGPIELGFDAETLIDRLARVGALTGSDPLVRLDFADDTLTVSAVDADRGEAVARMDASASAPLRTAMNPVFLRDFASVLGATALVHATGGMHPMIATNDGMTAVVMPRKCGGWTA